MPEQTRRNTTAGWRPFEELTVRQREQLQAFEGQLLGINRRHNLISPATEAYFTDRHTLHALALARRGFPAGARVVDWGTGGGLPAIPLAIAFPDVRFFAVDAVGKKIQAVRTMARRLGLDNLEAWHGRAEEFPERVHYAVSRATAPLHDLWSWFTAARSDERPDAGPEHWPPGLVCLKGGDLTDEIADLRRDYPAVTVETQDLYELLRKDYFREKLIVTVE